MLKPTLALLLALTVLFTRAQDSIRRCASVEVLNQKFAASATKKAMFELRRAEFNQSLKTGNRMMQAQAARLAGEIYTIPVVFHVVLEDPNEITDADIQAQLDTLNHDYAGANADSSKIPSWFKSLFGKSGIQFCLARRTPEGLPFSGIDRVKTARSSFSVNNEGAKRTALGGVDGWDQGQYMNIWICSLAGGILGYSSFPDDDDKSLQGVVIDYRAIPGGQYSSYNEGKTLTHETGHFFNLYHTWGDDNGACTGTDYVDDTPNQANSSSACSSGKKFDACTSSGNGIMYQNYMDYTADQCLVMFTSEQVLRMEATIATYYSQLITSNACRPVVVNENDATLKQIVSPEQRICDGQFIPMIVVRNSGADTLKTLRIAVTMDGTEVENATWSGSLAYYQTANVSLGSVAATEGDHLLQIKISQPNDKADANEVDDTALLSVHYYSPVTEMEEGFESDFPSPGWDVVNPDGLSTWKKINGVGASGDGSVMLETFGKSLGGRDDLRLREIQIPDVDSAFLSFDLAASEAVASTFRSDTPDTLEVLVSKDCGASFTSLYKKSGSALNTDNDPTDAYFIPAADEWRKDSISLASYINNGKILIAFRGETSPHNNIYLDNIRLRTVIVNPKLKESGFLVTPNPVRNMLNVQFYPPPTDLRSIVLYSVTGQKVKEVNAAGNGTLYQIDVASLPAGMYILAARFVNKMIQRKIIKIN
jgi:hypothetical protein